MKKNKAAVSAFLWALCVVLMLCVVQGLSIARTNFMGVSSSSFAFEVLAFYPFTAIGELSKVLAICFIPCFCIAFATIQISSNGRRTAFLFASILAYTFWGIGSLLQYPSLYQDFLSKGMHKHIFNASRYLSPNYFYGLGLLLVAVLFIYWTLAVAHSKRWFLYTLLALSLLIALEKVSIRSNISPTASAQQNVILIGIDSLRFDHLNQEKTPNLFNLTQDLQTISFQDHIIGIPRTFPSWMEILSGTYAAKSGIRHMFPGLPQQRSFYPGLISALSKQGYQTTVISDFAGDIFPRFNAGFDTVNTPHFSIQSLTRMTIDQSFPIFLPLISSPMISRMFPELKENPCFSDPEDLVSKSIKSISSFQKPFFLSIFFSNAHFPYAAPWPEYSKNSDPLYEGPFFFKKDPDLAQNQDLSIEDITQIRHLYAGSLKAIDRSLERLLHYLQENNLWNNTTIIVTADHGEDLFEINLVQGHGEHLRGENVLKVPLLLKINQNLKPMHSKIPFTTRMIDLAPTLAGLLKTSIPNAQGIDLSSWILGLDTSPPKLVAYSETEIWFSRKGRAFFQNERLDYPSISSLLTLDPGGTGAIVLDSGYENIINTAKHRSLSAGQFKLIYTPTSTGANYKLYDRIVDPFNTQDISKQNPTVFQDMKTKLLQHVATLDEESRIIDDYVVLR